MHNLNERSLEWALKHLLAFSDSDFYPRLFELQAISHDWKAVKEVIMSVDLEHYVPKSPRMHLAPKANRNYRIVHQLDPVDSLIYTAMIHEVCEPIEKYRIPVSRKMACSYRINPTLSGSFFQSEHSGWDDYISETDRLISENKDGFVLMCDVTDFYNQIYIHKVRNIISEAGEGKLEKQAECIEKFLLGLNNNNSRGIPVGPAASIVLAEAIMADFDNKILRITDKFVRYVDDIRIFVKSFEEAIQILHELTQYLHTNHRLVFSGEKTKILSTSDFADQYSMNEKRQEAIEIFKVTEAKAFERIEAMLSVFSPYGFDGIIDEENFDKVYAQISDEKQFVILSESYSKMLTESLASKHLNTSLIRHILRRATHYRIRVLIPIVLDNFEKLIPLIREMVIYLRKTMNAKSIETFSEKFNRLTDSPFYKLPFVNLWLAFLFEHNLFEQIGLPNSYSEIISKRSQALIALRKQDRTWVKDFRDALETLGPWDKRAVIFSSTLLSHDEMVHWLSPVANRGDMIDNAIAHLLITKNKPK